LTTGDREPFQQGSGGFTRLEHHDRALSGTLDRGHIRSVRAQNSQVFPYEIDVFGVYTWRDTDNISNHRCFDPRLYGGIVAWYIDFILLIDAWDGGTRVVITGIVVTGRVVIAMGRIVIIRCVIVIGRCIIVNGIVISG